MKSNPGTSSPAFLALIAALMTLTAMTIDINLPAIPAIASSLGSSQTLAQLTVTAFFLGFAVGQAIYGPVSDRYGRKPVLLLGVGFYIIATVACALSPSVEWLLAMRVLQGLGAGSGPVLGRTIVRDVFEGEAMARAMSFALAAFILAPIIAPSIGALILGIGSWRLIFWFLTLYGTILLVISWVRLDETLARPDSAATRPARIMAAYRLVLTHPTSRTYMMVATLVLAMLVTYLVNISSVLIDGMGLSTSSFGLVFACIAIFAATGSLLNTQLVRRMTLQRLIGLAVIGTLVGTGSSVIAVLAFPGLPWPMLPGLAIFFFCFSIVVPNATALAMQPHGEIIGSAASALGVIQSLVSAGLASLSTLFYDPSGLPMIAMMFVLGGAALFIVRAEPSN